MARVNLFRVSNPADGGPRAGSLIFAEDQRAQAVVEGLADFGDGLGGLLARAGGVDADGDDAVVDGGADGSAED